MPAHSSHLLQPLDIGCFGVLKRAYSKVIESQTRLGIYRVDKNDFLEAYRTARIETFTSETIVNSFAGAGISAIRPASRYFEAQYSSYHPPTTYLAMVAIQAAISPQRRRVR